MTCGPRQSVLRMSYLTMLLALGAFAWGAGAVQAAGPPTAVVRSIPTIDSTLPRALFEAALARGPQRIVASVEVRPSLEGGRFIGFQIVRFMTDGDLRDCTSLLPGDVVVTVNREALERPEQFMRAWEVVKTAPVLEIEVIRGGQHLVYRWKIEQ